MANVSLSEGEVPLSPGDARWYALHANKLGEGGGVRRRCRDRDRGMERWLDACEHSQWASINWECITRLGVCSFIIKNW